MLAATAAFHQYEPGKRTNFESASAFLSPTCPVSKKQANRINHVSVAEITSTNGNGLDNNLKEGRGNTGVELSYHKWSEFNTLPKNQKDEVVKWLKANKK